MGMLGAPVARAAPLMLSGKYSEKEPNVSDLTWTFAPCGPSCMTVTEEGAWSASAVPSDIAGQPPNNRLGTLWQWDVTLADAWHCGNVAKPGSQHFVLDPTTLQGWYAAWSTSPLCPGSNPVGPDGFAWGAANNYTLSKL